MYQALSPIFRAPGNEANFGTVQMMMTPSCIAMYASTNAIAIGFFPTFHFCLQIEEFSESYTPATTSSEVGSKINKYINSFIHSLFFFYFHLGCNNRSSKLLILYTWGIFLMPNECLHMPTFSALLSQANRAYSTLTRQLKAVIIEVCTVQAYI